MKRLHLRLASLALAVLLVPTSTPAQLPRPEIVIVGTVHEPTPRFNEDSLVAILRRAKPDLILLELDPSFFDSSGALREPYRNVSLESRAAMAYSRTNPAIIRPFDIEGRNRFYQNTRYFDRELQLNLDISRLNREGKLAVEARSLTDALRAFASVRDACGAERAEVINSSVCDVAQERKEFYAFEGIARTIELTPELAGYAEFWKTATDFWRSRTRAMVDNIVLATKSTNARRVIVLTGFEHRYRLRSELAKKGMVVTNYFDY